MVEELGKSFRNQSFVLQQDQQHFLLNVLELLEGTGIGWESLDSHNIEIFSWFLPLPVLISSLQVTIAKRRRTSAFCTLRRYHCSGSPHHFLAGLIDHVAAIGWQLFHSITLLIVWSLCFNVDPFPFKHKNRNWSQRYCMLLSWSCFSNGFLRSCVLFLRGRHRFCYVPVNAIHDSDPRSGVVLK